MVKYYNPALQVPDGETGPGAADEYLRALVVVVPTATGSVYRSLAYLAQFDARNTGGVLDLLVVRAKSDIAASRFLMVFDVAGAPVAGDRPAVPPWTMTGGTHLTWAPPDGFRLSSGLYIATSSSEVDYQPVAAAQEVDVFVRVKDV